MVGGRNDLTDSAWQTLDAVHNKEEHTWDVKTDGRPFIRADVSGDSRNLM